MRKWCALVDVGVLACLLGSRSVPVGFCCALGLLGASIDGGSVSVDTDVFQCD